MLKILILLNILIQIYSRTPSQLNDTLFPISFQIVNSTGHLANKTIHYSFNFQNKTLQIVLNITDETGCQHNGKIQNEPNSIVSLSICNGLVNRTITFFCRMRFILFNFK